MTSRDRSRARWGRSVWAVVALAVALRLTVLPGYMIAAKPDTMTVVLCTSEGAVSQTIDLDSRSSTSGKHGGEHPGKTSVCPFATAGLALAAPASLIVFSAPRPVSSELAPVRTALVGRGLAAPPPPSTGPPLSL
jgi:hypothetical protein